MPGAHGDPTGLQGGEEDRVMRYIFADYVFDTQRYGLHCAGTRVHLRPKGFQVLAYLLTHHDRVVPKSELLEHIWPNQFIGDATLNSCIMAVRKALGDRGRTPRFLHTLHGRGYRFVAAVEVRERHPADAAPHASPLRWSEGPPTRPRCCPLPSLHGAMTRGAPLWRRWTGNINRSLSCAAPSPRHPC